jgi:hypothetical protein
VLAGERVQQIRGVATDAEADLAAIASQAHAAPNAIANNSQQI